MPPWTVAKNFAYTEPTSLTLALSTGVQTSGSATANTMGGYAELIPSTPFDVDGMLLFLVSQNASINSFITEIAIGSDGSEINIIPGILLGGGRGNSRAMYFPISIPAGTRLSARTQCLLVGPNLRGVNVFATLFPRNYTRLPMLATRAFSYGLDYTTTSGIEIDPGAAENTKGAWVEITPSTDQDIRYLILSYDFYSNTTATQARMFIDVAVGANGSERIVLPDLFSQLSTESDTPHPPFHALPVFIPKGSRIAVRAQSTITVADDRLFRVALIGV